MTLPFHFIVYANIPGLHQTRVMFGFTSSQEVSHRRVKQGNDAKFVLHLIH